VKVEKYLLVFVVLHMFLSGLAMVSLPVKAEEPYVKVYVDQPLGYIPFVAPGGAIEFDVIIEVSGIQDDSPQGIVGWEMGVQVDPNVIDLSSTSATGATVGYILYEFAMDHGYSQPILDPGISDSTTGHWSGISEVIIPAPPAGAGEGYSGYKLVTLRANSNSDTQPCMIDLFNVEYFTADGRWVPVDEVGDGFYGESIIPEFPIGLALEMLFIPVVIYMFWRSKQRI
jgi:hypothetical protein